MPKQEVILNTFSKAGRKAAEITVAHDAPTGLLYADRAAKERGIAKPILRREALKRSLKAQLAARTIPLQQTERPIKPR